MSISNDLKKDVDNKILAHKSPIPFNEQDVKRSLDLQFALTDEQRKILFVLVKETMKLMNEVGMNIWFPDKTKPLFCTIFAYGYGQNKELHKVLSGRFPEEPLPEPIKQTTNLFPGI